MKKFLSLIVMTLIVLSSAMAQKGTDVNQQPEPLPAKDFKFPKYTVKNLTNGIKVFIIEDNEQPTIDIRMLVPGGLSVEGKKTGVSEIMTALMTKGAGRRNALQIAQTLDGMGASVGASSAGDYVSVGLSCITKHLPKVMDVFKDVVLAPTFPKDEFSKLQQQFIGAVRNEKSSSGSLASALAKKVVYGENHPYAQRKTEEGLKNLTAGDCEEYYKSVFVPNNVTIAVIGDVKEKEILSMLEKAFGSWKKGTPLAISVSSPMPMPLGVYFIPRDGSKQSSIVISCPTVDITSKDYETLGLAGNVMGGGFGARLFRTLREKYSFTYTPFAYHTGSKYANRFACGAEVKNDKTDSSITIIQEQLEDLAKKGPENDELARIKNNVIGNYLMAFEETSYIAMMLQNADFNGKPLSEIETYAKRVTNMSPLDIMKVSAKYLDPKRAYICVVGDPSLKADLAKFGKVYEYNLDLEPQSGEAAKMEKVSMSAKELIEKYADAIGGRAAINKVSSYEMNGKAKLCAGPQSMPGTIVIKAANGKMAVSQDFGVFKNDQFCDGTNAWFAQGPEVNKLEGDDLKSIKSECVLFKEVKILELGYTGEVLGKKNGEILLKLTSPEKKNETYFFDANTYLLKRIEKVEDTPQGPMNLSDEYENYVQSGDVKMPSIQRKLLPGATIEIECTYEMNKKFDDKEFRPASVK